MRSLAIAGHYIMDGLGQSEDSEQFVRHFLFMERGVSCFDNDTFYMIQLLMKYGNRYSVLPALSLDRILHVNIIKGSFEYNSFAEFIEGLLVQMNPFPGSNSVIVM
jgi:hypothetical protein